MKHSLHFVFAVCLCCSVTVSAQTTNVSDEKQEKPSATRSERQEQIHAPPTSQGGIEILSDTTGVDFRPYLSDMLKRVRTNWYLVIPDVARPPVYKEGKVSIEFAILKDGSLVEMKLTKPSGDVSLDRAAWGGITASNPLPPLPNEFTGKYIRLRFHFYYNLKVPQFDNAVKSVQTVQTIQLKEKRTKDDLPALELAITTLTAALSRGRLDKSDVTVIYYYRAVARGTINYIHKHEGEAIDLSLAQDALADLEKAIASGTDYCDRGFSIANAEYQAGGIARNQIHSESLAYSYWKKCAGENHPGCLNIMAQARVTGKGGQSVDLRQALELHNEVFKTDIRARCAGSYSARSIAAIGYFTGVNRPDDDELVWMNRACSLLDQLEAKEASHSLQPDQKTSDLCQRSKAEIEEFLYRLSRGERRDSILKQALNRVDDDPATKAVIEYLSGSIGEERFETAVASTKSEFGRCSAYFYALWYSELNNKHSEAEQFYKHMLDIGDFSCGSELVYAKKFTFGANLSEAPPVH